MILPTPFPKPPDPPDPPVPPAPPEIPQIPGGLPSLLYYPPPISPKPDAVRGHLFEKPRWTIAEIGRPERRAPDQRVGDEPVQWGAVPQAKPPPTFSWQCPECLIGHWESAVIKRSTYKSTMPVATFYDKANTLHVHDPNLLTTWFTCTRAHIWSIQETLTCPNLSCIWPTVV